MKRCFKILVAVNFEVSEKNIVLLKMEFKKNLVGDIYGPGKVLYSASETPI